MEEERSELMFFFLGDLGPQICLGFGSRVPFCIHASTILQNLGLARIGTWERRE